MMTPQFETFIHTDQMEFIDDLWEQFKSIGSNSRQRGYMIASIPPRLHTDWGRSALQDKAVTNSLGTAARTLVPALEDNPSNPTNVAANEDQQSVTTVVRSLDPTPDIATDARRLMPPPQLPVTRVSTRSVSRPIGGRDRSVSSSSSATTSKAGARHKR